MLTWIEQTTYDSRACPSLLLFAEVTREHFNVLNAVLETMASALSFALVTIYPYENDFNRRKPATRQPMICG
jgi:hypothetical protein